MQGVKIGSSKWAQIKCVALFPPQVDASRSVDEVFIDVCAIFGDLPKLEKKRRKKGKRHVF